MLRRLIAVLLLAITAMASLNVPVLAQDTADCAGTDDYVRSVRTLQLVFTETMGDLQTGDVEDWTPEELAIGVQAAQSLVSGLTSLTPPPAAVDVHTALTSSFQIWVDLLTAVQKDGLLGALSFIDAFNEVGGTINTEALAFEENCQVAFIDNDDDGAPEIGAGNQLAPITSAEIDPSQPLGSFQNPIPVGEAENVGGGWAITVVAVRPDDTEAVLAENVFNDPPIEGRQFFVADVMVENIGTDTASFDGNFRLRATGLLGDYRAFAPDDRCGVVANEWEDVEIAPGEQVTAAICWSVPTGEVDAIRLYDVDAITETRVYFSLNPVSGTATPVAGA